MFHISRSCFVFPLEGWWPPQPVETILPSLLCLSSVAAGAPTSLTPSGSDALSDKSHRSFPVTLDCLSASLTSPLTRLISMSQTSQVQS